jgi:hypothetical protein
VWKSSVNWKLKCDERFDKARIRHGSAPSSSNPSTTRTMSKWFWTQAQLVLLDSMLSRWLIGTPHFHIFIFHLVLVSSCYRVWVFVSHRAFRTMELFRRTLPIQTASSVESVRSIWFLGLKSAFLPPLSPRCKVNRFKCSISWWEWKLCSNVEGRQSSRWFFRVVRSH